MSSENTVTSTTQTTVEDMRTLSPLTAAAHTVTVVDDDFPRWREV